jgi:hypothetical protein
MEVIQQFICPCTPGKVYSQGYFRSHHAKTKRHIQYTNGTDIRASVVEHKKMENELESLKNQVRDLTADREEFILRERDYLEKLHLLNEKNHQLEVIALKAELRVSECERKLAVSQANNPASPFF